jgi:molybdate transport system substrate-binding protein
VSERLDYAQRPAPTAYWRLFEMQRPVVVTNPNKRASFRVRTSRAATAVLLCLSIALPLSAAAQTDRLLIFAAASLKNAMDGVATAYEKDHDVDVRVNYAGSSTLARQIERGAPADLFISANQVWMDRLEANDRIDKASRIDLLANALVLVAPADSDVTLTIGPRFPIVESLGNEYLAMANTDSVPAGIYGRQALTSLGVWAPLSKQVAQVNNVRAALALVARGETPLGVVYSSDAVAEDDVRVVDIFAADSHDPIVYPAAILEGVDNPQAEPFMAYLQGEVAARIFEQWGFTLARHGG